MNKKSVIEKIEFVLAKRGGPGITGLHITNALETVRAYVESQTGFDYQHLMSYIQTQIPSKLGGSFIYVANALEFLKNELKSEHKKVTK